MARKRSRKRSGAHKRRRRHNPENQRRRRRRSRASASHHGHHRRHHRRTHRRRRRNPSGFMGHAWEGVKAAGFGMLAAAVGLGVGFAVMKMGLTSKGALVGANAGAALVGGTALGMLDPVAGRIVAHNFTVSAGQFALAPVASTQQAATPFEPSPAGSGATQAAPQTQGLVNYRTDQFGNIIDNSERALGIGNVADYGGTVAAYDYASG